MAKSKLTIEELQRKGDVGRLTLMIDDFYERAAEGDRNTETLVDLLIGVRDELRDYYDLRGVKAVGNERGQYGEADRVSDAP